MFDTILICEAVYLVVVILLVIGEVETLRYFLEGER